jgi:hypothetical protein
VIGAGILLVMVYRIRQVLQQGISAQDELPLVGWLVVGLVDWYDALQ